MMFYDCNKPNKQEWADGVEAEIGIYAKNIFFGFVLFAVF